MASVMTSWKEIARYLGEGVRTAQRWESEFGLELDDGAEVVLSPGDVLIENGTRHRWRVVGDVPATLASFIIGARRH